GALAQTLAQDRAGFTSAEGQDWYTKSQADLQAMSDARPALLEVDRDRKEGARKFSDEAATVASILERMGKTETYVSRHPVIPHATTGTVAHAAAGSTVAHAVDSGTGSHGASETATRGAAKAVIPSSVSASSGAAGRPIGPSGAAVVAVGPVGST